MDCMSNSAPSRDLIAGAIIKKEKSFAYVNKWITPSSGVIKRSAAPLLDSGGHNKKRMDYPVKRGNDRCRCHSGLEPPCHSGLEPGSIIERQKPFAYTNKWITPSSGVITGAGVIPDWIRHPYTSTLHTLVLMIK